jgi:hypothetical protein
MGTEPDFSLSSLSGLHISTNFLILIDFEPGVDIFGLYGNCSHLKLGAARGSKFSPELSNPESTSDINCQFSSTFGHALDPC